MIDRPRFVPYPPIERHGVVGDRRTAALIAADGTVNWLCLPNYDGPGVFGALLDADRGGFWRLGPAAPGLGRQRYRDDSAVPLTTWEGDGWALELLDAMARPADQRSPEAEDRRVLLRRLCCIRGDAPCAMEIVPRHEFDHAALASTATDRIALKVGEQNLTLWTSRPIDADEESAEAAFVLREGEEFWAVLASGDDAESWTVERAAAALDETDRFWRYWAERLRYDGPGAERVRRSALTIHLLSYAPTGSPVAAATASLPERIGGDRNWDYRYAWVRDASLALATLTRLDDLAAGRRYLDCLTSYGSSTDSPRQIVYGVDGAADLPERERTDLVGYRGSRPVRFGNAACGQRQLDSLGYFVECALVYLEQGGEWRDRYWDMVRRAADHTVEHWREPEAGIWEMRQNREFVSGKVMSWVALDRAVKIAARTGHEGETDGWQRTMAEIHAEVLERGWSESLGAFRQRYDADALDAAALLVPITGFLPPDDLRVLTTLDRIAGTLTIGGFVHRYHLAERPGLGDDDPPPPPLGEFEGAFLPCTFWLATAYAQAGRVAAAEAILAKAEAAAGELGLVAEEIDARSGTFLGNTPLLFAHVEHVRAVREVAAARERA